MAEALRILNNALSIILICFIIFCLASIFTSSGNK